MDGASSPTAGGDGAPAMEEPDEAWVREHLWVKRRKEHGGVVVGVRRLAWRGAAADVDVAKTGAWLQAHGGEVREFDANSRSCYMQNGHGEWGVCWCRAEPGVVWVLCVWLVACVCVCACAGSGLPSRLHMLARGLEACNALARLYLSGTCLYWLLALCMPVNEQPAPRLSQCTGMRTHTNVVACCVALSMLALSHAMHGCGCSGYRSGGSLTPADGRALARVLPHCAQLQDVDIGGTHGLVG